MPDGMELRLRYTDEFECEGEHAAGVWLIRMISDRLTAEHLNRKIAKGMGEPRGRGDDE
jgi:hypothetical protein